MGVKIRMKPDSGLEEVARALREFEQDHPGTDIVLYRYNPVSIRMKIVSEKFKGMSRSQRHDYAMSYLKDLDPETYADLSLLVCLIPGEGSMMDYEFEDPEALMP
ncbi:MAG: hypothetical protein WDZ51_13715 [Pirellulaceae bacterium]